MACVNGCQRHPQTRTLKAARLDSKCGHATPHTNGGRLEERHRCRQRQTTTARLEPSKLPGKTVECGYAKLHMNGGRSEDTGVVKQVLLSKNLDDR